MEKNPNRSNVCIVCKEEFWVPKHLELREYIVCSLKCYNEMRESEMWWY